MKWIVGTTKHHGTEFRCRYRIYGIFAIPDFVFPELNFGSFSLSSGRPSSPLRHPRYGNLLE
jgi:hypothetical protein